MLAFDDATTRFDKEAQRKSGQLDSAVSVGLSGSAGLSIAVILQTHHFRYKWVSAAAPWSVMNISNFTPALLPD